MQLRIAPPEKVETLSGVFAWYVVGQLAAKLFSRPVRLVLAGYVLSRYFRENL